LNSNFGQTQIYKSIAGGNREGLNFQQIRSFSFPSISTAEINKIAKIVELQNNKIQTEETLLQKYQSIKRGLMGDLLGGNGGRKRKQIK
jgi:type I restriction enzyme S subunit